MILCMYVLGITFVHGAKNLRLFVHLDIFWQLTIPLDGKTVTKNIKLQISGVPEFLKGIND